MSLSLCKVGEVSTINKIIGSAEIRNHLYDLGFTEGAEVSIVNELAGNIIVNIKGSRVALDKKLANKISVI